MTKLVIVLSVVVVLLAVGFLSTITVLFTLCGDVILSDAAYVDVSTPSEENAPDFFLPFASKAGDMTVNGSDSQWLSEEGDYMFLSEVKRGRVLLQLDTINGSVTLRLVDILSLGSENSIQFFINSGSDRSVADTGSTLVWVRIITDPEDKNRINCMVGLDMKTDWAFVATWAGYGGSTFQIILAFQETSASMALFNYAKLSETDSGNKFAAMQIGSTSFTHSKAGQLPSNVQLILNYSYSNIIELEPGSC